MLKDYTLRDYEILQSNANAHIANLGNVCVDMMRRVPTEVKQMARLTEQLSNIMIIDGNTYFIKGLKDFKVISSDGVVIDGGTVKLKAKVQRVLEPKANESQLATHQSIKLNGVLDDLLIKHKPLTIATSEQRYRYEVTIDFKELYQFNNVMLKLGERSLSYPNVSLYYVDTKHHKRSIRLNDAMSFNTDTNKNADNVYLLDFEMVEADNLVVVLEDIGQDLVLDALQARYVEYEPKGEVIFEVLNENEPILKLGVDSNVSTAKVEVSHNMTEWTALEQSNAMTLGRKVMSFNTINPESLSVQEDVYRVYLRLVLNAQTEVFIPTPKTLRETFAGGEMSLPSHDEWTAYALGPIHYGSNTNLANIDFKELYDRGEYAVIQNKHYIKGFIETPISKIPSSMPTAGIIKTKELRVTGEVLDIEDVDISTKNIYAYELETITKNTHALDGLKVVVPYPAGIYSLKQGDDVVVLDLSCGYINSALEVLVAVKPDMPVYLLDDQGSLLDTLEAFEVDGVLCVSLLDNEWSKTYPITPLKPNEIGFIDNILVSPSPRDIQLTHLKTKLMHHKDVLSYRNTSYSTLTDLETYKRMQDVIKLHIPALTKSMKLLPIAKDTLTLPEPYIEVPYINGHTEFQEVLGRSEELVGPLQFKVGGLIPNVSWYVVEGSGDAVVRVEGDTIHVETPHKVMVTYSFYNQEPRDLYSIDPKGYIYFAGRTASDLDVFYRTDRIIMTGRKARQLDETEMVYSKDKLQVNNASYDTSFVYQRKLPVIRTVTPVISNLKVSYITLDPRSI